MTRHPAEGRKPAIGTVRASVHMGRRAGAPTAREARSSPREAKTCPTCFGLRRVYACDWWPGCDCQASIVVEGCNSQSHPCPDCGPAPRAARFAAPRPPSPFAPLDLADDDEPSGPNPSPATVLIGAALVIAIIAGILSFLIRLVI